MQWDFTDEQVAKGEVDYSLEEFRSDFYEEVRLNFPEYDPRELDAMCRLAYDICYCTAVRSDLGELLEHCRRRGLKADMKYIELIRDSNLANIDMLKAIFAKKVSELKETGLSNEAALKKLEEYHQEVIKD